MSSMLPDFEVRHGRALLAVHDCGSIGAAARGMGVAQSTLSETLLSLERLIGVAVIARRAGQVARLTAVAEVLLPYARALVAASETALAASAAGPLPTTIRLGTIESISSFVLPRPLMHFRSEWTQIDVRVTTGLCEDLRARLRQGQLDAVIMMDGNTEDSRGAIADVFLCLFVRPSHHLADQTEGRLNLVKQTFLLSEAEGPLAELLGAWIGFSRQETRILSAGSVEGVKRGVLNNETIGVLPDYAVADELASGSFVALSCARRSPRAILRLATSEVAPDGVALTTLMAHLGEALRICAEGNIQPA